MCGGFKVCVKSGLPRAECRRWMVCRIGMFEERGKAYALESRFLNLRSWCGPGLLNGEDNFSIAEIGKHLLVIRTLFRFYCTCSETSQVGGQSLQNMIHMANKPTDQIPKVPRRSVTRGGAAENIDTRSGCEAIVRSSTFLFNILACTQEPEVRGSGGTEL